MAPPAEEIETLRAEDQEVIVGEGKAGVARNAKPKKKGKAKAKAKGKGKGKKKAKAKAKGTKKLMLADGDPDAEGGEEIKKEKGPPKATGLRKRVLAQLEAEGRSVEEAIASIKLDMQGGSAEAEEVAALERAHRTQEDEAKREFEDLKAKVQAVIDAEIESAKTFREASEKRNMAQTAVTAKRGELLEAQKSLAMLEVMQLNHVRMKELEAKRKQANEAAELARKNLAEQKQREKEALEATKRLLEEARQSKGKAAAARGAAKRPAPDPAPAASKQSPSKKQVTEVEDGTIPATLADEGEDIE